MDRDDCPACGAALNAATDPIGDATPAPGDLTICLYCTALLKFDHRLRRVQADWRELSPELRARCQSFVDAIR